jgi:hypothetical protein
MTLNTCCVGYHFAAPRQNTATMLATKPPAAYCGSCRIWQPPADRKATNALRRAQRVPPPLLRTPRSTRRLRQHTFAALRARQVSENLRCRALAARGTKPDLPGPMAPGSQGRNIARMSPALWNWRLAITGYVPAQPDKLSLRRIWDADPQIIKHDCVGWTAIDQWTTGRNWACC